MSEWQWRWLTRLWRWWRRLTHGYTQAPRYGSRLDCSNVLKGFTSHNCTSGSLHDSSVGRFRENKVKRRTFCKLGRTVAFLQKKKKRKTLTKLQFSNQLWIHLTSLDWHISLTYTIALCWRMLLSKKLKIKKIKTKIKSHCSYIILITMKSGWNQLPMCLIINDITLYVNVSLWMIKEPYSVKTYAISGFSFVDNACSLKAQSHYEVAEPFVCCSPIGMNWFFMLSWLSLCDLNVGVFKISSPILFC